MKLDDFVYKQTYNGCLNVGVKPGIAANTASKSVEDYRKGKRLNNGGVSKMIQQAIKDARRAK